MKPLLVALLALTISLPAFAEAGKRESVKELITLMEVDSMIENMYSQMDQMFASMGQQLGIKASEQKIFENYMKKVADSMQEEVSWEKMEEPMIDIYLKNYTEDELQDMLTFYRSSTGRSLIKKMPTVMRESMLLSQNMMMEFMPKMKAIADEFAVKLQKHRESK